MSNLTSITTAAPTTLQRVSSLGAGAWRNRHDLAGFAVVHTGVVPAQPVHNSMKPMGAAPVEAGRRVYAAKQAAPPRGRYR